MAHAPFGAIAALLACWSLLGWMTGKTGFTNFYAGRPSLSVLTAVCLILIASGTAALPRHAMLAKMMGAITGALGLGIVAVHAFDLVELPSQWVSSPITGCIFAVASLNTYLLADGKDVFGQILSFGLLLFCALLALGHASASADLYKLLPGTGVAIPTVIASAALAISQLVACRSTGIAAALTRRNAMGESGVRTLLASSVAILFAD
jgi:hypothetical protein